MTSCGVHYCNHVYRHVTGWNDFEPALSLAEQVEAHRIWRCAWDMLRGLSPSANDNIQAIP
jgi:hypothetical protein